jgi:hypothetical protein
MKVIVCGGRDYADKQRVESVLDEIHAKTPITELIQGGADGADRLAFGWACRARGISNIVTHHAEWEKYGRRAGPIRNALMLEDKPDLVIAFPGGRGTANMIKQTLAAGVRLMEVEP